MPALNSVEGPVPSGVEGQSRRLIFPKAWHRRRHVRAAGAFSANPQHERNDDDHEALAKGWPAALGGETPPPGWTPCTPHPERGTVGSVLDERPHWFAAPFLVSPSEAQGPARLVIDTTGRDVPTDLIKTLWVNGQPVGQRIEFFSTQRHVLPEPDPAGPGGEG